MTRGNSAAGDRLTDVLAGASADLLAYCRRRAAPEDAADLLAETMVTAWRRVELLPSDPEQARMWLFGIARNMLLNADRADRRRSRLADRMRSLLTTDAQMSAPPADAGSEVLDAIARLEPELAELVRLVHWDGFSLAQAAELTGIPAPTARGRYHRAKEALRAALGVTVHD
ncbi:RNA polymerase sigma factor [Salinibacterium sp. ZJ450]|uniref:RNA polymerase sigma factor n=1 Tax=Salinibacterium sp. ZJ450 TaxID=2708338 RepID=UPI0014226990|nr:sigma-70 family RNA polymerase sigma factor [Salinibacterium sp. ZJ450]